MTTAHRATPVRPARRPAIDLREVTGVTVQVRLRRQARPVVLTQLHRRAARDWVAGLLQKPAPTSDLTTTQAAAVLGVSRPHLIGLIDDGLLPCHRVGSHRRLARRDVERLRARWQRRRPALAAMVAAGDEIGT